jgi:hypothetical protein
MYKIRKVSKKDEYKIYDPKTKEVHSILTTLKEARKQMKLLGGSMASGIERVGMGLSNKQTKDFVKASYAKKKDAKEVDGYKLDKSISTKRSKVYTKDGKVIVTHAGTDSATDWFNNLAIPFGYTSTDRYKQAKKVQKEANAKYGKDAIETVSHSQSGKIVNELAKEGLTKKGQSTTVNPAIFGRPEKGVKVIRSDADVVSALTKTRKKDMIIPSKNKFDILTEHSPDILERVGGMCCMCQKKIKKIK